MAYKNKYNQYVRPIGIEGFNLMHGTCHIRLHTHKTEADRAENEALPLYNECETDVKLPESFEPTGTDTENILQQLMYAALSSHEVSSGKDESGNDFFDTPYADMLDC